VAAKRAFSEGQRAALARAAESGESARAVVEKAQRGELLGPDGCLPPFVVSESTVRRAAADSRESGGGAASAAGASSLQEFEAKLLQELAREWADFEERRAELAPAQRLHQLRELAHTQKAVARAVADGPQPPAASGPAGHEAEDHDDDLISQIARATEETGGREDSAAGRPSTVAPEAHTNPQTNGKVQDIIASGLAAIQAAANQAETARQPG
jgi:hypothetical protein